MEFAVGHFLDLNVGSGTSPLHWQNFFIKENVTRGGQTYSFIPFGFSGLTTNRQGDNIDATWLLQTPSCHVSTRWEATQDKWVAKVQVVLFNPDNKDEQTLLTTYVGQVTTSRLGVRPAFKSGSTRFWTRSALMSPPRRITQELVGYIPTSSNIQLF